MKQNNKGFSYVEMIIVLAIMTLMVGFLTISIGTNKRNEMARAAEKMESHVNKARTISMTKGTGSGCLNIGYVDKAYYVYVGEDLVGYGGSSDERAVRVKELGEKLCSGDINITLSGSIDEDHPFRRLKFKQSTGGIVDSGGGVYTGYMTIMFERNLKSTSFSIIGLTGKVKH